MIKSFRILAKERSDTHCLIIEFKFVDGGVSMKLFLGLESKKERQPLKISYLDTNITFILSTRLREYLTIIPDYRPLVIICIGTDRSTGDSLGPLVGTQLKRGNRNIPIFGTLDEPVHAMNLNETIEKVFSIHRNPYIIAIDACLGQLSSVGSIQLADGPVKPGAGVNKDLPPVGDMHLTGIVNVGGFMEYFVLQNTRLSLVVSMAEIIASSLLSSIEILHHNQLQRSEIAVESEVR